MSYRQTVEAHHRSTYAANVELVAQQMQNPLRACVTTVTATGEAQSMADLIGAKEYIEAEDYSRRNPENSPKRTRRWLIRRNSIEDGDYITKEERFDQTQDSSSKLVENSVLTVERGVYDRILGVKRDDAGVFRIATGGIMGDVAEGKTPDSRTVLPSGNYIGVQVGGGGSNTGLNAEKLRAGCEGMELEDFGLETDQEIFGLISPKQKTDLINLALATKGALDPFQLEAIRSGKPGTLLGINWKFSNRVPYDANGHRLIPLWTRDNVVAGFWQDVIGDMWNDTNAKNLPYYFTDANLDAGRIEDKGVRIIRCAEA